MRLYTKLAIVFDRAGKRKADDASSQPAAKKAKTADSSSDDSDSEVLNI
jgi:hypothetical protein